MDLCNRRALKEAARHSLANARCDPRKNILVYTGASVAVSLIATVINYLFGLQIENTGGLGGLSTRSMLSTAQSVLQLLVAITLPFWNNGYRFATMNMAREKEAAPSTLLEGFRRFGPLLRCMLLLGLIYAGVGIVCFFFSSQIFMMSPLSDPLFEIAESLPLNSGSSLLGGTITLDAATQAAIIDAFLPMVLIMMVVFLAGVLLVSYNYRMANYLILDHPGMGALAALRGSRNQMRGNKAALFRLDLSFLWFYVLQILASLLAYGDYLMAIFGVPFPASQGVVFFFFLILSLVCQGGLYIWAKNRVDVTYAKFYDLTILPVPQKRASASRDIL